MGGEEMKVAVEVVEASDLMPKDGRGSSNPFVEVDFAGERQRTATRLSDLSPSWNQTLLFPLPDPPSRLPDLSFLVSVFHDPRPSAGGGGRRHFLGRVRLSGSSVAPSSADAALQRFPLDKRGLFSHIRGDLALRLYLLPDSASSSSAAAGEPNSTTDTPDPIHINKAEKKKKKKDRSDEPRVFFSVGAGAGGGSEEKRVLRDVPARAAQPPPQAKVLQLGHPDAAGPRPEFGLVETYPPIAARFRRRGAAAYSAGAGRKISSTYDLVELMYYLYVSVVKARDLPAMDLTGSVDPYAEVRLGNYKAVTKHLEKNPNPIWRHVFAFPHDHLQSDLLEVIIKDKDLIKDDFVGRIAVDLTDVPLRLPPDSPLAPLWYRLEGKKGENLPAGEVMLAVWVGTQADEAFPDALHADAHSVAADRLPYTRSKVYFSPRLAYLRVVAIAAQDLVPADRSRAAISAFLKVQLGHQRRRTRPGVPPGSPNPVWNEEMLFVAAEPFDEPLVVTAEDRDEPVGRLVLRVASAAVPRNDHSKPVESRWYSFARPAATVEEAAGEAEKESSRFSSKVHLRLSLDTAYHVLDESTHYSSDFQPASKKLRQPAIGILELGILSAHGLVAMKAKDGRATDAYCVAKYGPKWVRTRTILNTLAPRWNEQYTWEVFDPCTVITVAMFDNSHVTGSQDSDAKDQRIGKVRIRLSTLEAGRVYTHLYPLLVLQPSGLKKTGELHLAVRFTCVAWVNMVALYGRPLLPKMHYAHPIPVLQLDLLRHHAMQIVAARLGRAEPPLGREVVEYMLDVDSHMFSLRRSKANFQRMSTLFSSIGAVGRWLDGVRNWRNPITTLLVHVLFFILVFFPELIFPTIFLYLAMIGILNFRHRPRHPPHMDTRLSHAEQASQDELDEEFDTFPTTKGSDQVRMRYDRMRSVAGRVQAVAHDLATQGERAQALLSWRDPRATTIFIIMALVAAIVLYVVPFQVVAVIAGLYLLRHPRLRRKKTPSVAYNFYRRLPAKADMLI